MLHARPSTSHEARQPRRSAIWAGESHTHQATAPVSPGRQKSEYAHVFAPLALHVWAYANGRLLHSGHFRLRDKTSRPPRVPLFAPLPTPSRKTASFRFPLKDYASKLADLRSPVGAPLMNF